MKTTSFNTVSSLISVLNKIGIVEYSPTTRTINFKFHDADSNLAYPILSRITFNHSKVERRVDNVHTIIIEHFSSISQINLS